MEYEDLNYDWRIATWIPRYTDVGRCQFELGIPVAVFFSFAISIHPMWATNCFVLHNSSNLIVSKYEMPTFVYPFTLPSTFKKNRTMEYIWPTHYVAIWFARPAISGSTRKAYDHVHD